MGFHKLPLNTDKILSLSLSFSQHPLTSCWGILEENRWNKQENWKQNKTLKDCALQRVTCLLKLYDSSCLSLLKYSTPRGHGELSVRDWIVKSAVSMKILQTQLTDTDPSIPMELFARTSESFRYQFRDTKWISS